MTKEDIISMAREAGINVEQGFLLRFAGVEADLERFADLVAAAEREACAKVCEDFYQGLPPKLTVRGYLADMAKAIRARGQDPMPLFDDWGGILYKSCPPCNQQCNQGRDCPNA